MDFYKAASVGSFLSCLSMRSSIIVLRVSLSSKVAARIAKRMTCSVASLSLAVRSAKALVRSDSSKVILGIQQELQVIMV